MRLVRNEQTKLFANALDRVSTAFVTAAVLAPISNVIFGGTRMNSLTLAALCYIFLIIAVVLDLLGRRVLKGLRE